MPAEPRSFDEEHQTKAYAPFAVKQVNVEDRTFSGLASTWEIDLDEEVVEKGAFAKTLSEWRASNGRRIIPLMDWHNRQSVRAAFGRLEEAEETDEGLDSTFSVLKSNDGDEYLARIEQGYLNGLSIGFFPIKTKPETRMVDGEEREIRVIQEVKLMEVSLVVWGANPGALIDPVKEYIYAMKGQLRSCDRDALRTLESEIHSILDPPDEVALIEPDGDRAAALRGMYRHLRTSALA